MKRTKQISSLLAAVFLMVTSCNKDGEPSDLGLSYTNESIGSFIVYRVMDITIDEPVNRFDTIIYFLKEKVESSYTDNRGEPAFRIERYWRTSDTLPWTIKDIWYSNKSNYSYEKVEENERYVKLAFPVRLEKTWNGNSFNTQLEWEYEYEWVDEPYSNGYMNFNETAKVLQRDNINFVEREECWEIYAKEIGLVRRQFMDLDLISGDTATPRIGKIIFQNAISYGVE